MQTCTEIEQKVSDHIVHEPRWWSRAVSSCRSYVVRTSDFLWAICSRQKLLIPFIDCSVLRISSTGISPKNRCDGRIVSHAISTCAAEPDDIEKAPRNSSSKSSSAKLPSIPVDPKKTVNTTWNAVSSNILRTSMALSGAGEPEL